MFLQPNTPLLALCLRGSFAVTRWLDTLGPIDPKLAQRTDPQSLRALYAEHLDDIMALRSSARIHAVMSKYFGGRVSANHSIDVSIYKNKSYTKLSYVPEDLNKIFNEKLPAYFLTVPTVSNIVAVISPLVSSRLIGLLLSSWQCFGLLLAGITRCRLTQDRAQKIGKKDKCQSFLILSKAASLS